MRRHTPVFAAGLVMLTVLAVRLEGQTETNEHRAFMAHPAAAAGVMPFANYIRGSSTLSARHRELLILRTSWLSRSPYYWSVHSAKASAAGLTPADVARIAGGPQARGWDAFEAALLRAADELHHQSFVSDATWKALGARFSTHQLMDAVFTVTEFSMLAAVANTLRTPVDTGIPTVPLPEGSRPLAGTPRLHVALSQPRVPPIEPAAMTPAIRTMLDPRGNGRPVAAVYRTFAQHPALYVPRQVLSEYIRLGATLSPRVREMLILRIGYLCQSAYEWAAHARAGRAAGLSADELKRIAAGPDAGWSANDAAILRAVDEMYADDVVSERTWKELSAQFDQKQLLDVLITTGGYRMVSMALNTLGVPLEPDSEPLPPLQSPARSTAATKVAIVEGMWSDPPVTILARFCASWCTDAGIERLNALLDNPANDSRPVAQLSAEAGTFQRDTYIKTRMTPAALAGFPIDPADDPGLLKCEPWGLARQMLAPHQIEIRRPGDDRMELHYGEWDARRTVYMDGRKRPEGQAPTRLGHSVGRWEGDTLVVETAGVTANQMMWRARHSDQLRVVERFTRSDDGAMLHLTATLTDPWSLREPLVIKRNWRWAPTSIIAPYDDCKPPIAVKKGVDP